MLSSFGTIEWIGMSLAFGLAPLRSCGRADVDAPVDASRRDCPTESLIAVPASSRRRSDVPFGPSGGSQVDAVDAQVDVAAAARREAVPVDGATEP